MLKDELREGLSQKLDTRSREISTVFQRYLRFWGELGPKIEHLQVTPEIDEELATYVVTHYRHSERLHGVGSGC